MAKMELMRFTVFSRTGDIPQWQYVHGQEASDGELPSGSRQVGVG